VQQVEQQMLQNYTTKHQQLSARIDALQSLFEERSHWWWQHPDLDQARIRFGYFIANMVSNFGDGAAGYQLIQSTEHRAQRRQQITSAILSYRSDRETWQSVIDSAQSAA
jgi:hypothetical protein